MRYRGFADYASAFSLFGDGKICAPGLKSQQITVFNQQVRSLNLAYFMHKAQRASSLEQLKVAVVGAGATGVTFTAAMLCLGHHVTMFERQTDKLYLQKGCYTRFLHPNNYQWPEPGSEASYADLPILSWRAANAATVSRQLLEKFEQIVELCPGNFVYRPRSFVKLDPEQMEIDWQSVEGFPRRDPSATQTNGNDKYEHAGSDYFDRIVLAVGFGIEEEVDDEKHFSYWRNDSLNQIRATSYAASRMEYWMSGSGDGALIDVQRLKIQDYDQSRFIHDVWERAIPRSPLKPITNAQLVKFRNDVAERTDLDDAAGLYKAIEKLKDQDVVLKLDEYLRQKRRDDTFVVLNSRAPSFQETLGKKKQSFLNALICQRLYNQGAFIYLGGEMTLTNGTWTHPLRDRHHKDSKLIIRHGARSNAMLDGCWTKWKLQSSMEAMEKSNKLEDFSKRLWPVGWWNQESIGKVRNAIFSGDKSDLIEYLSPDIGGLFEGLIVGLSSAIKEFRLFGESSDFRMCVCRLVTINYGLEPDKEENKDKEAYYQQITGYSGTLKRGVAGRVFRLDSGAIGLAYALERAIFIGCRNNKTNQKRYAALWHDLKGNKIKGGIGPRPRVPRLHIAIPLVINTNQSERPRAAFALYVEVRRSLNLTTELENRFIELVRRRFNPMYDQIAEQIRTKLVFFADTQLPPKGWNSKKDNAADIVHRHSAILHTVDTRFELPAGMTPEATRNRYQEAGDETLP